MKRIIIMICITFSVTLSLPPANPTLPDWKMEDDSLYFCKNGEFLLDEYLDCSEAGIANTMFNLKNTDTKDFPFIKNFTISEDLNMSYLSQRIEIYDAGKYMSTKKREKTTKYYRMLGEKQLDFSFYKKNKKFIPYKSNYVYSESINKGDIVFKNAKTGKEKALAYTGDNNCDITKIYWKSKSPFNKHYNFIYDYKLAAVYDHYSLFILEKLKLSEFTTRPAYYDATLKKTKIHRNEFDSTISLGFSFFYKGYELPGTVHVILRVYDYPSENFTTSLLKVVGDYYPKIPFTVDTEIDSIKALDISNNFIANYKDNLDFEILGTPYKIILGGKPFFLTLFAIENKGNIRGNAIFVNSNTGKVEMSLPISQKQYRNGYYQPSKLIKLINRTLRKRRTN